MAPSPAFPPGEDISSRTWQVLSVFVCLSVTWSDLQLLVQFQAPAVPFLVCPHLTSEDEGVCPISSFYPYSEKKPNG